MLSKKSWQLIIRIIVAIAALWIVIHYVGQIEEISQAFIKIRFHFVMLAFLLFSLNIFIQYYKWLYILRIYYPRITRLDVFGSIIGGFTLGLITPGRIGELGRGMFLGNLNQWHVTGLTLLDKGFSSLAVLLMGSIACCYLFLYYFDLPRSVFIAFVMITIFFYGFLYIILKNPRKIILILNPWIARITFLRKLDHFMLSLEKMNKKNIRIIFLLSILFSGIVFLQFLLLVEAFSDYPVVSTLSGIIAAMSAKLFVPISIGDLGVREGAAIFFLAKVEVLKIHAFNSSLLLFTMNILIPSIVGIFLIHRLSIFSKKRDGKNSFISQRHELESEP